MVILVVHLRSTLRLLQGREEENFSNAVDFPLQWKAVLASFQSVSETI